MALRRPPTRIDLKADDVEEYDKVRLLLLYLLLAVLLVRCRICN
jgi:hypothetical protein